MDSRLSPKQIGKRIIEHRKLKGLSQEDLSRAMEMSRPSLSQIESGKRKLSVIELIKLSDILGFSLDKFLGEELKVPEEIGTTIKKHDRGSIRISVPTLNVDKFKNVLLYILERCAGKPNVGETVLYKLLYFVDFNYFEKYEEHLTGSQYRKLPYGPVPQKLEAIINQMIERNQLQRLKTEYHGYVQIRYIPLEKSDLTELSAAEKDTIDQVIGRFSDWSAAAISEYSHQDMPWKATENGEIMDYELVFYRDPPFSVRTYDEGPERP